MWGCECAPGSRVVDGVFKWQCVRACVRACVRVWCVNMCVCVCVSACCVCVS